jgi:DNA-binding NtrC family response regulator
MWQALRSLFARQRGTREDETQPFSSMRGDTPIVALVTGEDDERVLTDIAARKALDVHFARSCGDANAALERLQAPVIIFDRDWPGTDWRGAVEGFASVPQRACVILMSGVTDEYLWQELIRRGGYDVLTKPLRTQDAERVITLALSYWRVAARPAPLTR